MNRENRIYYLDTLRIIALFFMVLIHVIASDSDYLLSYSDTAAVFHSYSTISRFCVPIFFMISGIYFLNPLNKIDLKSIYLTRIMRLLIAFLFWSFLYSSYTQLDRLLAGDGLSPTIFLADLSTGAYHMWFIPVLIGLYIITPFLRLITQNKKNIEYFLLLFIIFCLGFNTVKVIPVIEILITNVLNHDNMNFVIGYAGYFIIGYYLYKNELSQFKRRIFYFLGIISILATFILTNFNFLTINDSSLYWYNYLLLNTFFLSVAVFLVCQSSVSKWTFSDRIKKLLPELSKLSFGAYLVHALIIFLFKEIGFTTQLFNPILSTPIITSIVFLISLGISFAISKIRFINKYIA